MLIGTCNGNIDWIGDTFCDDDNNNLDCNYDGGDCCGPNVDTTYCIGCQCLNDATTVSHTTTTPIATIATTTLDCRWSKNSDNTWVKICEGECQGNHSSKGDGICDDINNNLECGYDGNDCFGPDVNMGWVFFQIILYFNYLLQNRFKLW